MQCVNAMLSPTSFAPGPQAFPPMGKHECKAVQRLAALYGVTAGLQGSSKKKFVVVSGGGVCVWDLAGTL